jgi:hypothetical protein
MKESPARQSVWAPRRRRVPAVRAREHWVCVVRREAVRDWQAGAGTEV